MFQSYLDFWHVCPQIFHVWLDIFHSRLDFQNFSIQIFYLWLDFVEMIVDLSKFDRSIFFSLQFVFQLLSSWSREVFFA